MKRLLYSITMLYSCSDCRYFSDDPAEIEDAFPGLNSLSSAYASVRSNAGVCSRHGLFISPRKQCADFEHSTAGLQSRVDIEDSQSSLMPRL